MLFNSLGFMIFFPIVTVLYYLAAPPSQNSIGSRWFVLLGASCFFYMWFVPKYILILFATIIVDYLAAIFIEQSKGKKRLLFLWISILLTCGILFYFKYFNFVDSNLASLATHLGMKYSTSPLEILLPIGLSFHTFQSLSYVIEVYRGNQKAEKNFGIYSLYVMFYPQLVAGPIERPQNLLHQFREHKLLEYSNVVEGLKLMVWGFFKKVVVADSLASVVNQAYQNPSAYNGLELTIATVFFAYQIYCDFSGYTDIARGSARVMGFDLMENFCRPYFATSISNFWRRWHISLSTWFKDYVYFPLGGNRKGPVRTSINLMVTFLTSGIWHGANWTYVTWGGLNGIGLIFENIFKSLRLGFLSKLSMPSALKISFTFFFICITWVYFRASNVESGNEIIRRIFFEWNGSSIPSLTTSELIRGFLVIGFLFSIEFCQEFKLSPKFLLRPVPIGIAYAILISLIMLFGVYEDNKFIYFQF